MKKNFLLAVLAISGCLLSCGGNAKAESTSEGSNVETTVQESTSAKVVTTSAYKVENGKITPTNGKPLIIDFSATWCPPCQKLKPIFAKIEEEFSDRINFVTVDVDENTEMSQSYGVQSIPTLIFMNPDGQIQNTILGFQDRDQLLAAINTYFGF